MIVETLAFLGGLWRRAHSPAGAFRLRASEAPRLGPSLRVMLLLRTPLAFVSSALGYWSFRSAYQALRTLEGDVGELVRRFLPVSVSVGDLRSALAELPHLPEVGCAVPWLALAAPLGVLSLWLHDAAWDHGCLWMLGGLKAGRGLRVTLIAEAEALSVGSIGVVVGLAGALPHLGLWLTLPLAALTGWFWILRGFALAAWHECPVWKGVGATLLHLMLATCCLAGLVGCCLVCLAAVLA